MKKIFYLILALAFAGNSLQVKAQNSDADTGPEYFAVYERAYQETSSHGVYPRTVLPVAKVEPGKTNIIIHFNRPVSGPAIVNIYNNVGDLVYNQYAVLNGKSIAISENKLKDGKYFMHVFTETAESIYQFDIYQSLTNN